MAVRSETTNPETTIDVDLSCSSGKCPGGSRAGTRNWFRLCGFSFHVPVLSLVKMLLSVCGSAARNWLH